MLRYSKRYDQSYYEVLVLHANFIWEGLRKYKKIASDPLFILTYPISTIEAEMGSPLFM